VNTSKKHATDNFIRVAFPTSTTAPCAFPSGHPRSDWPFEKGRQFPRTATLDLQCAASRFQSPPHLPAPRKALRDKSVYLDSKFLKRDVLRRSEGRDRVEESKR